MTILPNGSLTVNVRRSGGLLGRAVDLGATFPPGTPGHAAALAAGAAIAGGAAPSVPSRRRDGFTYRVEITDDGGTQLLHAVFVDPLPEQVAELLSVLIAIDPQ